MELEDSLPLLLSQGIDAPSCMSVRVASKQETTTAAELGKALSGNSRVRWISPPSQQQNTHSKLFKLLTDIGNLRLML